MEAGLGLHVLGGALAGVGLAPAKARARRDRLHWRRHVSVKPNERELRALVAIRRVRRNLAMMRSAFQASRFDRCITVDVKV